MPEPPQAFRRVEELDRQIASTVEKLVRDLHQELGERIRQGSEELLRRLQEVSPQIPASFLDEATFSELIEPAKEPPAPAPAPSAAAIFAAIRRVDEATGQADILKTLVEETGHFASRAAFFLIRGGAVRGWGGSGFDGGAVEKMSFPTSAGKVWGDLEAGSGAILLDAAGCQDLAGQLGVDAGGTGLLVPFVLRGQLAGALYTDWPAGAPDPDLASVQLLTHSASQALETASIRKGGSRALHGVSHEVAAPAAPAAAPEAVPEPAPEPEPAAVPAVEAEEEPAPVAVEEPVAVDEAAPAAAAEEGGDIWEEDAEDDEPTIIGQRAPAVQPPPTPSVLSEAVGQQTVRLDISTLQGPAPAPAARPAPAPAAPPAAPAPAEFELEPEPTEAAGFELEPEPPVEVQPPVEVRPPAAVSPPPASTEVQPPPDMVPPASTEVQPPPDMAPPSFAAPPAPEPPAASGGGSSSSSTQVRPPDDLQGPGTAFAEETAPGSSGRIPAGEEALHEEARRLARLLVSEIKLYNEEVIEEGRMAGNIYSRLREDIDRSRQMYTERIDPRIQEDYFHQELVQRLAGGDPKLLGM